MKQYQVNVTNKSARLYFMYSDEDSLIEVRATIESESNIVKWFLNPAPMTSYELKMRCNAAPNLALKEIAPDLSFKFFYEEYGNKMGKAKAEKQHNLLTDLQKIEALAYVQTYKQKKLLTNSNMLYPATYLSQRVWEDK